MALRRAVAVTVLTPVTALAAVLGSSAAAADDEPAARRPPVPAAKPYAAPLNLPAEITASLPSGGSLSIMSPRIPSAASVAAFTIEEATREVDVEERFLNAVATLPMLTRLDPATGQTVNDNNARLVQCMTIGASVTLAENGVPGDVNQLTVLATETARTKALAATKLCIAIVGQLARQSQATQVSPQLRTGCGLGLVETPATITRVPGGWQVKPLLNVRVGTKSAVAVGCKELRDGHSALTIRTRSKSARLSRYIGQTIPLGFVSPSANAPATTITVKFLSAR